MGNLDNKKGSGEFGSFELTKEMMQYIYDQDHKEGLSREEYAALVREVNGGAARARFNNELEKFLENNALASEKDFIDYAIDDIDMRIDWYQKEVDFFDDPFDIDPDKRTYWFYRAYKDYLTQKLKTLTDPQAAPPPVIKNAKVKMDARSVAMMHYYLFASNEGEDINESNKNEIAKKWDCKASTLVSRFGEISSEGPQRHGTITRKRPRKKQFELVLHHLEQNDFPASFKRATAEYRIFLDNNDFS